MTTQPPTPHCAPASDYESLFGPDIERVNTRLDQYLRQELYDSSIEAQGLWEAMRYGTLNGGKRIRSVLALETCRACGGDIEAILPAACAIELIHAQSLMHDDLPCMDNDDMRRGKPSVHKAFGESTAVLAGDALIALAFGLISKETPITPGMTPGVLLDVISNFSDVTSVRGLVNGQFVDILYEGKPFDRDILEYIHTHKTGALFRFAMQAGARLAGAPPEVVERFSRVGQTLGLIFQIVDDLLDIDSSSETLGKTAGKDQLQEKATYPAFFGVDASIAQVTQLTQEVNDCLEIREGMPAGYDSASLKALVGFISSRVH